MLATNEGGAQLPHDTLLEGECDRDTGGEGANQFLFLSYEDEVGATGNIAVAVHRVFCDLDLIVHHHWSGDPVEGRRCNFLCIPSQWHS